jgi:hypothetical protein
MLTVCDSNDKLDDSLALSRPQSLYRDSRDWITTTHSEGTTVKVWNTLKTTYKVSDFISWQRDGALFLNPEFQRRAVWKAGAKSYLIDTIIRGLPMPIIFLRDKKSSLKDFTPQRDVVDGQQRLRTVISFIAPKLLKNFDPARDEFRIKKEHNEDYQGRSFDELPESVRRQILDYQFSVNVFPSDTADREVKQVFQRMNSSGYKLNGQELRNAEFFGAFKSRAETLANEQLDRWRVWRIFNSDELARMNEVELTSELLIVMLRGISDKNDKLISSVYAKYDEDFAVGAEAARRFRAIFDTIDESLKDAISLFKMRTMFYALFVALYDLQFGLKTGLEIKKAKPAAISKDEFECITTAASRIAAKTAPKKILDSTTRRTTHVPERRSVVDYLLKNALACRKHS